MLFAGLLVAFIVLGCFLNLLRKYLKLLSDCRHLPSMKSWHIIGDVPKLIGNNKDLYRCIMQFSEEYREHGLLCLWICFQPVILVFKDKYVHDVIGNTKHIEKNLFYKLLEPWLGNGLLTSTGSKWFKSRKMLTPSFHYNILNNFLTVMQNQSNILCKKLDKMVGKGEFNIRPYITNFALDTITETAMGKCVNAQGNEHSEYIESVSRIADLITYQSISPWLWPQFLFNLHPYGKEAAKCLKYLHDFTDKVIEERSALYIKDAKEKTDNEEGDTQRKKMAFLDTLLDHLHKGEIDKKSLREEVDTFMFEGHDTTAAGISWTLYFIAAYPNVQKKLQKEVDDFYGENEELTLSNIKKLFYLECIIKEVQRLYPSVPIIGRVSAEDFKIGHHEVKKGTPISIVISSLHRDPQNFPDPDTFDPDRFLLEDTDRSPHAFIPFSAGPRNCIGQKFAMLEEKVVISRIIHKFNLETTQTIEELEPSFDLVLNPSNGIRIKLSHR
ncbi:cytochrome P450 4V2 isoform X1 [Octopus sinensis]|nr:cytochrome P450 4V2 isoform X1 [Octopus sinensis]